MQGFSGRLLCGDHLCARPGVGTGRSHDGCLYSAPCQVVSAPDPGLWEIPGRVCSRGVDVPAEDEGQRPQR